MRTLRLADASALDLANVAPCLGGHQGFKEAASRSRSQ
jgi:hypothetical protein